MTKLLKLLMGALIVLMTFPFMTACSDEDEPKNLKETEYIKVSNWDVKPMKEASTSVILQSDSYKDRWGVFYSMEKSELVDFIRVFQLSISDDTEEWSKLGVIRSMGFFGEGITTLELDKLQPNTTYYYIAYYDKYDDVTNKLSAIYYTEIRNFTTAE